MTYFKIIQNNIVTSVGSVFLKWNTKKSKLFICDVDKGELVQTYDEAHIYRDDWMKPLPKEAGEFESANVVIISEQEYEELHEIFDNGDVVEVQYIPEQTTEKVQPPIEEKPMSIAEMRETIVKQQEQINMLIKKLS